MTLRIVLLTSFVFAISSDPKLRHQNEGAIPMAGKESKFDAMKLRTMITEGKTAQQILDAFGIDKVTLKNHLLKLMQMDEKFYKIGGMETRAVSGNAKFSKNGLRLSPSLLSNYGFNQSDEFKVSCLEEGKIVLEKK